MGECSVRSLRRELGYDLDMEIISRVHATIQPTLSVGWSVRPSVTLAFLAFSGGFGVTASAQLSSWSISSLPLPTRMRLG